jgi:two-component system sensor histidine kinase PhcS
LEVTLARLKDAEVQLVQSEKMNALGKLAAGLLHEINNPLNFTITALGVAQQEAGGNAELRETLFDIGEGMNRIKIVVSDLRAFASPTKISAPERFTLDKAFTLARRLTAHELRDIQVQLDGPPDVTVFGSETQVVHVLMNLLMNSAFAVRTIPADRLPKITVRWAADADRVRVCICDNGTGVRPEDLPRICEPFFTTRDVGEGMGLGLSICHTIVRSHGGRLAVRSEWGKWTEVCFDLPLAREDS